MADSTNLTSFALVAVAALAIPVAFGAMYSLWRSQVTASLPPELVEAARNTPPVEAPPAEPATEAAPRWPREVDGAVFAFAEMLMGDTPERADVVPDAAFRIDLSGTPDHLVSGASIDLDRDGNFDERWTFKRPGVERLVSPQDDGKFTEAYSWSSGGWTPTAAPAAAGG